MLPTKLLFFIFTVLLTGSKVSFAQRSANEIPCPCPRNNFSADKKPTAIFRLKKGVNIGLTGYKETNKATKVTSYQEFAIYQCGKTELISLYGADQYCRIRTKKDTLFIDEYEFWPTDQRLSSKWSLWQTEKIYVRNKTAKSVKQLNRTVGKYTRQQIAGILTDYKQQNVGRGPVTNSQMILAQKLLVATLSGSWEARTAFIDFPNKFKGLDGATGGEYNRLKEKLTYWEAQVAAR